MTATLPPFPVDDFTLNQIDHALHTSYGERDETGTRTLVGGDFTLSQLLNFLSGYDPTAVRPYPTDGYEDGPEVVEYLGQLYSERCVIAALITEVRRLRGTP